MNSKKLYFLYFSKDSLLCNQLFDLLITIPEISNFIKCIDVEKYEIGDHIKTFPTLSIGKDKKGNEILKEEYEIFVWILDECKDLVQKNQLKKEKCMTIENFIIRIFKNEKTEPKLTANPTVATDAEFSLLNNENKVQKTKQLYR